MGSKYISREKLILWLRDAIDCELEKPEEETDWELVDECSKLLAELMGTQAALSEEELAEKFTEITGIAVKKPAAPKRTPRFRRMLTAACVAVLLMASMVTVCAFNPTVRNMVMNVLKLGEGANLSDDGITYVYNGAERQYAGIEELVQSENLDILYPTDLPKGLKIEKVVWLDSNKRIVFSFNEPDISFHVFIEANIDLATVAKSAEIRDICGLQAYITYNDDKITLYTSVDSVIYCIVAPTEDIVVALFENLFE